MKAERKMELLTECMKKKSNLICLGGCCAAPVK